MNKQEIKTTYKFSECEPFLQEYLKSKGQLYEGLTLYLLAFNILVDKL
jgi:hypothetical protein